MFDMRLCSSSNQTPVELKVNDAANSGIIFSLTATGANVTTWIVNGTSTQVTLPNSSPNTITDVTWCSYKISRSGSYTYVTITNKSTGEDILERTLIGGASETGGLGNIVFVTKRYNANFAIDNIVVREIESGDVPVAEPTTCTILFKNESGTTIKNDVKINTLVGATVNANDYVASIYTDGKKYIYKSGNNPITAVADAESNVITLVFREANTWTYTINAVDGEEALIQELVSGTQFEGDNKTAYFPKAFKKSGVWYQTSSGVSGASYYSFTLSEAMKTKDITYSTTTDIDYFFECEDMAVVSRRDGGSSEERGSKGAGVRINNGGYIYTTAIAAGTYTLRMNCNNPNSGTPTFNIKLWDGENLIEIGKTIKKTVASSANFAEESTTEIVIPEGMCLAICNNTGYVGNPTLDYIILKRTGDAIASKPITAAGWATYCSPYALDLENATNLTDAYIVTGGSDGVLTKTSVKGGTVPANTGLLLKGTEGSAVSVTIPVVASSTTNVDANILEGVTADTPIAAEAGWVLMASPSLGFYQNANAFTVGANTAYIPVSKLPVPVGGSARAFFSLDDESSGIKSVQGSEQTVNGYYNLNGQRVEKPAKGLYIVNGKKVVMK